MHRSVRTSVLWLMASLCGLAAGCTGPNQMLRQSQLQAYRIHQQSVIAAQQRDQAQQLAQSLAAEKTQLEHQAARLQSDLQIANGRLENLQAERSQLQSRYVGLLNRQLEQGSPLSDETTRRFEELARKYPEFEFDPRTGVSKFHSDILFSSGSAEIKASASPLLKEFTEIMNSGEAQRLNILVVGHTDDKPIRKSNTRQQHPTNWHLSTNRANSVLLTLSKLGITQSRMGAAGYSKYQPVVANTDESARQKNRRVEIFVLAPDAVVAGWDPATSRN